MVPIMSPGWLTACDENPVYSSVPSATLFMSGLSNRDGTVVWGPRVIKVSFIGF